MIISIPDEESFTEMYIRYHVSYFVKLYYVPIGFEIPAPHLRLCIAFLRLPKGGCCSI